MLLYKLEEWSVLRRHVIMASKWYDRGTRSKGKLLIVHRCEFINRWSV